MFRQSVVLIPILWSCLTLSASADPISATFLIDVVGRCNVADNAAACGPFRQRFPLTMSFDSAVRSRVAEPGFIGQEYGPITFSPIPLAHPPLPSGSWNLKYHQHGGFTDLGGQFADIREEYFVPSSIFPGSFEQFGGIFISVAEGGNTVPSLTAQGMVELIGRGEAFGLAAEFAFAVGDPFRDDPIPGSVVYLGEIVGQIDGPAPIPEPTSIVLLALGCVGLRVARRYSARDRGGQLRR